MPSFDRLNGLNKNKGDLTFLWVLFRMSYKSSTLAWFLVNQKDV